MEKDKAAKKAKLEREKALSAAIKAQQAGKSSNGRQDAPWLHPGITVKVSAIVPQYGLDTKSTVSIELCR